MAERGGTQEHRSLPLEDFTLLSFLSNVMIRTAPERVGKLYGGLIPTRDRGRVPNAHSGEWTRLSV